MQLPQYPWDHKLGFLLQEKKPPPISPLPQGMRLGVPRDPGSLSCLGGALWKGRESLCWTSGHDWPQVW